MALQEVTDPALLEQHRANVGQQQTNVYGQPTEENVNKAIGLLTPSYDTSGLEEVTDPELSLIHI